MVPSEWALSTVKNVFTINPKNSAADELLAGFVPMASISDGFSNSFEYDNRTWKEIKSGFTHFADGDVAVAKISPCLENRKSFVARNLPNGIGSGTTELFVFRSRIILPEFTLLFFKSAYFISACVGTFNGVVGQQRAARNVIEDLVFPIPPLQEQKRIVKEVKQLFDRINEIDHGRLDIKASVEKAKSKILSLAIQGKLVPQDPAEEPAVELLRRINPAFIPSHNLHYDEEHIDGWVLVPFKEVFDSIPSKPYQIALSEVKDNGRFPVISQGAKDIDGYSDDIERVFRTSVPVYVFGDHTKVLKYVPHDFIVGADGVKILKPRWDSKYLFYNLLYCVSNMENRGYSRNYQYLSSSVLHIPPVAEQNRIVSAIELLFNELDSLSIVTK